jgi:hypothetical protein
MCGRANSSCIVLESAFSAWTTTGLDRAGKTASQNLDIEFSKKKISTLTSTAADDPLTDSLHAPRGMAHARIRIDGRKATVHNYRTLSMRSILITTLPLVDTSVAAHGVTVITCHGQYETWKPFPILPSGRLQTPKPNVIGRVTSVCGG